MSVESLAVVSPVPAAYRGRVLTPSNNLVENGLYVSQVVLFVGLGLAPAILGGLMATGTLWPANLPPSFLPALAGLGLSAGLMWLLFGQLLRNPWSCQYVFAKTQSELLQRGDAIVNPNDPQAILVEVIPRRNWGQVLALQNAEDRGFLAIDRERGHILIEGDNKRYQIPASALVASDVELMNPSAEYNPKVAPVGLVVLTVRDQMGERELPLRPMRTVGGDPLGGNYLERANELQRRIQGCSPQNC